MMIIIMRVMMMAMIVMLMAMMMGMNIINTIPVALTNFGPLELLVI